MNKQFDDVNSKFDDINNQNVRNESGYSKNEK